MHRLRSALFAASLVGLCARASAQAQQETNLLSLGEGTLPVVEAPSYGGWPAINMLDESPATGWACETGQTSNRVFVFEMAVPATLTAFELDTASIDGDNRAAKDVVVEVSATSKDAGFTQVLRAALADRKDKQRFPAAAKPQARWVRLTLVNNHGDERYIELMGFRGYGVKSAAKPLATAITGTYETSYGRFHVRQQGTAITGCYEHNEGLFDGALEGAVAKLTWNESKGESRGPAVFVFTPDGRGFTGLWWQADDKHGVDGDWSGKRIASEVGGCPHWSGSVAGELKKEIAATGRARLYGILFDSDSATLRPESFPTLDEVAKLLAGEPSWSLTIEGHTDATGTAAHNQTLSEQRAKSVKDYLTKKGTDAVRLLSAGFGQSKPVTDNATELGRARNRRVELVRK